MMIFPFASTFFTFFAELYLSLQSALYYIEETHSETAFLPYNIFSLSLPFFNRCVIMALYQFICF